MNKMKQIYRATALLECAVSGSAPAQGGTAESPSNLACTPSWYIAPGISATHSGEAFGGGHRSAGGGIRFGQAISPSWEIKFGPAYARKRYHRVRGQQDTPRVDGLYPVSRIRFHLLNRNAQAGNVTIPGYTDRLARHQYNLTLSQRRADLGKCLEPKRHIVAGQIAIERRVAPVLNA